MSQFAEYTSRVDKQLNNNTFAPIFEKRLESDKKEQNKAVLELEANWQFYFFIKKQNFKIIYQCFVFSYLPYIFFPLLYWA